MSQQRQPGWWYPWIFVAGMLVVVAVNGVLVTYAIETFPGLHTEDAYRKGLKYNETLAAAENQARRGWQMQLVFAPGPAEQGRTGTMTVTLLDRTGQPLERLEVEAMVRRPTQQGFDFTVPLDYVGSGTYQATIALPLPGQWEARILAGRDSTRFQDTRRFQIP